MTRGGARTATIGVAICLVAAVAGRSTAADGIIDSQPVAARRLQPPARSFSLIATGDIITENAVTVAASAAAGGTGARFDFAPQFAPITAMLSSADIAICHMEIPIGDPGARPGGYGHSPYGGNLLLAPHEIAGDLHRAGFDRCSTASNHSYDLGDVGIDSTLAALDAVGITHVGTARSPAEAVAGMIMVNGVLLAHLSYTRFSNTPRPEASWRLNFAATPDRIAADVEAARTAGAEVVVVSVHIAQELLYAPLPADRQFVTELTAVARIDMVIEHGPHVIQPLEPVNGTWVFWSVGNFISGMGVPGYPHYADPRTLDEMAATARFTEVSPGTFSVEPWPVLLCNDPSTRTIYAPLLGPGDATTPAQVRADLQACIQRSTVAVAGLH